MHKQSVYVAAHRKAERLEIAPGGLLLIRVAVADVKHLHALCSGIVGELDSAGDRLRLFGLGPVVPGFGIEGGIVNNEARFVCGIVDRGLVEVDDYRRWQVLIAAGLVVGRPVRVGDRLLEPYLGQRVDREAVCPILNRRLHPEFGVE